MARSFQAGIRWKLGTTPIAVRIPSASCLPYRNCQSRAMRCGSRNKKAWKWRFLPDCHAARAAARLNAGGDGHPYESRRLLSARACEPDAAAKRMGTAELFSECGGLSALCERKGTAF